jgi:hypothetical protein
MYSILGTAKVFGLERKTSLFLKQILSLPAVAGILECSSVLPSSEINEMKLNDKSNSSYSYCVLLRGEVCSNCFALYPVYPAFYEFFVLPNFPLGFL